MQDDPFLVLGLTPEAGESEIRRKYLELVRENPPDRAPERFTEVRKAYDELCNPVKRLQRQLFSEYSQNSLNDLLSHVQGRLRSARIPARTILQVAEKL